MVRRLVWRGGELFHHLMLQHTLSCLIMRLASSTTIWTQPVISKVPGLVWLRTRALLCGAVKVTVSLCSWPIIRDKGESLVGHFTSLFYMPRYYLTGKNLHFPAEACYLSEVQGVSYRGLCVCSHSPEKLSVILNCLHFFGSSRW